MQLAAMTCDGAPDIVRLRNGNITYWLNLGRGRFGPEVVMRGVPRFDLPRSVPTRSPAPRGRRWQRGRGLVELADDRTRRRGP